MLLALFLLFSTPAHAAQVTWGWEPRDPYLTEDRNSVRGAVTGLDAELVSAALKRAGDDPTFIHLDWNQTLIQVQSGLLTMASGAYRTPEREAFAFFSKPYREEVTVLIASRAFLSDFKAQDPVSLFADLRNRRARIGWVKGYYFGPLAEEIRNSPLVQMTADDASSFTALVTGQVDAILLDQLVAANLLWKSELSDRYDEYPVPIFHAPIHALFSRKTYSRAAVDRFDNAMDELRGSGEYQRIVSHHVLPMLLQISTAQPWFLIVIIIATTAAAAAGAMIARRKNYSLIGAIVLAALPALGGGVLRDIFIGRYPVAVVRVPFLFPLCATTAILIYLAFNIGLVRSGLSGPRSATLIKLCDATALGALSVAGVMVALEMKVEPLILWGPFLGAITAGGGGILANVLMAQEHHGNLIDAFYLEIALFWAFALSLFLKFYATRGVYSSHEVLGAVIITSAGGAITRFWAIRAGWKGLRI